MLRIHFAPEDLARIRFAHGPDPMWELLTSMHRLQRRDGSVLFGEWRRRALTRLPAAARLLTPLAPSPGYSVDFLTPASGGSLAAQAEALRAIPRSRVRGDLDVFTRMNPGRRLPPWCSTFRDEPAQALGRIADAALGYFDACLGPHWPAIRAQVDRDRVQRGQQLATGGWSAVLGTLHSSAQWQYPVLELDYPVDQELHLEGRGLILQPSFFCRYRPTSLADSALPPVLVYPIDHELGWAGPPGRPTRGDTLSGLLGRIRADLLRATADGAATTGDLARRTGTTPPNASRHLTALRKAFLIASHRHRNTVLHTVTPLGRALLDGDLPGVPA